jgi:hypothetical protein
MRIATPPLGERTNAPIGFGASAVLASLVAAWGPRRALGRYGERMGEWLAGTVMVVAGLVLFASLANLDEARG